MNNETLSAYVPVSEVKTLEKKVVKLNKTLSKHDLSVSEISREMTFVNDVATYKIDFSIPASIETGYKYVGNITHKDGIFSIFSANNIPLKDFVNIRENRCSVCGKKHSNRTNMFIFEKEGQLVNVGSSCSSTYANFNVTSVFNALTKFSSSNSIDNLDGSYSEAYETYNVTDVLCHTMAHIDKNASYEKMIYGQQNGSSYYVRESLENKTAEIDPIIMIKSIIAKKLVVKYFRDIDDKNNFLFTLRETIFKNGEMLDVIPKLALGRMVYAIYDAFKQEKIERLTDKNKTLEFVGNEGEEVIIELKNIEMKNFTSNAYSYYGTTSTLAKNVDMSGNNVSFFTSSNKILEALRTNEYVKVKGIVKEHKMFGTIPVTTLSRPKLQK